VKFLQRVSGELPLSRSKRHFRDETTMKPICHQQFDPQPRRTGTGFRARLVPGDSRFTGLVWETYL
jgi:hypothetical protein